MVYKQFRDMCTMFSVLTSWKLAEDGNQNPLEGSTQVAAFEVVLAEVE